MPTPRDLLNEAKASIREVEPAGAEALLEGGGVTFLDVREPDEYEQGAIPNAVHLPRGHLEFQVEGKLPDKAGPIVVYCAGGVRSAFAAKTMQDLGYADVQSLVGGFNKWKDDGPPLGGAPDPDPGPAQPLPAPPAAPRGRRGGPAEAARLQGAAPRRRRPRVHRPRSTWRPPASARSASSTWTWSTSRTCSARSCTTWTASASARSTRPRRR